MSKESISLGKKIFKGTTWLGFFRLISQTVSWGTTILIARILLPTDYGLLAMATILTGYVQIFSNLGLGSAIIQKKQLGNDALSSVFWFSILFSMLLALCCFPLSYLTGYLMHEPRVVPLTQVFAITFIFGGLGIVPSSLLNRRLDFKSIGMIEMTTTIVSCFGMIIIAKIGMGVWALIGGIVIRSGLRVILLYSKEKWVPKFHFSISDINTYIKFGLTMTVSRSARYLWISSDKFFAGRAWNTNILGYYSLALQLAQIPTEKLVTLINQVSYPAFSKLQDDKVAFNNLYLNITKITASVILPLFLGGFIVGEDLIKIVLTEKWYPMIFVFRYLCLSQIFMALNAVNNFVHAAQGKPQYGLYYNVGCLIIMPISFYLATQYGLNAIIIPWMLSFVLLCVFWILFTIKKIGVNKMEYLLIYKNPFLASALMFCAIEVFRYACNSVRIIDDNIVIKCVLSIIIGGSIYIGYFFIFDKGFLTKIKNFSKN